MLLQRKIDCCLQIESLWNTYFPNLALNDIIPTYQFHKTGNKEKLSTGE